MLNLASVLKLVCLLLCFRSSRLNDCLTVVVEVIYLFQKLVITKV